MKKVGMKSVVTKKKNSNSALAAEWPTPPDFLPIVVLVREVAAGLISGLELVEQVVEPPAHHVVDDAHDLREDQQESDSLQLGTGVPLLP